MPQKMTGNPYITTILDFLEEHPEAPRKPRRLSRLMEVVEEEYPLYREAFKELKRSGRLWTGRTRGPGTIIGRFHANAKGFGFVKPTDEETAKRRGDIFVSLANTGGAMTGDLVEIRTVPGRNHTGRPRTEGEVTEILERGIRQVVGTLENLEGGWFLEPEGAKIITPLIIDTFPQPPSAIPPGTKVVAEIVEYPSGPGMLPVGSVTEILGAEGELETETQAIIIANGLPHEFSEETLAEARDTVSSFDSTRAADAQDRRDLSHMTIVTIDPIDARDFDDAISLERVTEDGGEALRLGVHIADVSYFVPEGSALDEEARERGTSVYFPRRVVPMLPTGLSQGVCALKQDTPRFTKSVFITYDGEGGVLHREVERTVITSTRRLTYEEAQDLCDDKAHDEAPQVAELLRELVQLARVIRGRRRRQGMLSLDLPEVSLVLSDEGKVRDARPTKHIFSHTMIEMFMVEANEAVSSLLAERDVPVMRRIHPSPTAERYGQLVSFAQVCGHLELPDWPPSRQALQGLVDSVNGRPEGYAVNLAVLRSLQQAKYSIQPEGHFALASDCYCHFTSPIRRYPDLVVHRMVERHLLGSSPRSEEPPEENDEELAVLALQCSETERRAEATELELRQVLVLQHLATKIGTCFEGIVTAVTSFGLFVQSPRFLIEGLLPRDSLGGGWWEVSEEEGAMYDEVTGVKFRIGDVVDVTVKAVDVAQRHLDLALTHPDDQRGNRQDQASNKKKGRIRQPTSQRRGSSPHGGKRGRRGAQGRHETSSRSTRPTKKRGRRR